MTEAVVVRFFSKVDKGGECWVWKAGRFDSGYGLFKVGGKSVKAHRYSFVLENGPIPEGMCVCHSCDNPSCVNPAHLWLGSYADNNADRDRKGRAATGKRNGSHVHPEAYIANRQYGERNWNAKLTEAQVQEIRQLYATGKYTQRDLGSRFGVVRTAISRIVNGKRWAAC